MATPKDSIPPEQYWNEVFRRTQEKWDRRGSSWLSKFQTLLQAEGVERVLEIGFGSGNDTRYLAEQGYRVTATDFSEAALATVKPTLPEANLLLHDTRRPFPLKDGAFDLAVAGLSLHYFDSWEMAAIIGEISRMLNERGLLLLRLNSVHDPDSARDHPIARYFYSVEDCRKLFGDWENLLLQEITEEYYGKTKVIVEGMFRKISR